MTEQFAITLCIGGIGFSQKPIGPVGPTLMLEAAPKDLGARHVKTQRQTIVWRARSAHFDLMHLLTRISACAVLGSAT